MLLISSSCHFKSNGLLATPTMSIHFLVLVALFIHADYATLRLSYNRMYPQLFPFIVCNFREHTAIPLLQP